MSLNWDVIREAVMEKWPSAVSKGCRGFEGGVTHFSWVNVLGKSGVPSYGESWIRPWPGSGNDNDMKSKRKLLCLFHGNLWNNFDKKSLHDFSNEFMGLIKMNGHYKYSGGSRISPRWGRHPRGGANIRFCQIFPKTVWNWNNLGPRGGGGRVSKILLCRSATEIYFETTEKMYIYFIYINLRKKFSPNMGLEPMTLRLKVWCSTDWANRALWLPRRLTTFIWHW